MSRKKKTAADYKKDLVVAKRENSKLKKEIELLNESLEMTGNAVEGQKIITKVMREFEIKELTQHVNDIAEGARAHFHDLQEVTGELTPEDAEHVLSVVTRSVNHMANNRLAIIEEGNDYKVEDGEENQAANI